MTCAPELLLQLLRPDVYPEDEATAARTEAEAAVAAAAVAAAAAEAAAAAAAEEAAAAAAAATAAAAAAAIPQHPTTTTQALMNVLTSVRRGLGTFTRRPSIVLWLGALCLLLLIRRRGVAYVMAAFARLRRS